MKRTITRSLRSFAIAVAIGLGLILLMQWMGYAEQYTTPVIERILWGLPKLAWVAYAVIAVAIVATLWGYTLFLAGCLVRIAVEALRARFRI